jgi:NADPH:quinone reductase-like Zn-dependent oxidoreductase
VDAQRLLTPGGQDSGAGGCPERATGGFSTAPAAQGSEVPRELQLARSAGVHVIGTVRSDHDTAYVQRLGANEVVDIAAVRIEDAVRPVDVVIDLVGGDAANRSMALLARGGRLVSAVSQPDQERATRQGVTAKFILVDVRTEPLTRIAALLDAQQLTTNVGTLLPLADVRIADRARNAGGEAATPSWKDRRHPTP